MFRNSSLCGASHTYRERIANAPPPPRPTHDRGLDPLDRAPGSDAGQRLWPRPRVPVLRKAEYTFGIDHWLGQCNILWTHEFEAPEYFPTQFMWWGTDWWGLNLGRSPFRDTPEFSLRLGFAWEDLPYDPGGPVIGRTRSLEISLWFPLIALGIPVGLEWWRWLRQRRRAAGIRCACCGYGFPSLTCPECGSAENSPQIGD